MPTYPMPFCRVEIAIQSVIDGRLWTLFSRRKEDPYKDLLGLPGGVIRVDLDGDLNATANRVVWERLECAVPNLQPLCVVGAQGRDPRGAAGWGLSIVYRSLSPFGSLELKMGKRIAGLKWVCIDDDPAKEDFAFDHLEIAAMALKVTREEVGRLFYPSGFVPDRFTLSQLQVLSEQIMGKKIDKSSFRRKLVERDLVEQVKGEFASGQANRPAAIYSFKVK